ncbi:glucan biosynthesis protein [Phytohalomonas tamaricis]|uniref:glucan biosynthesis protein n=1 Tax=Phytohalomonas tamaricis TaxID=2081032 RepID=UPI000D0B854E|nr:glucan biosynthesis protein D [Phytohalomonas tamaricis]
MDRRSLLKSSLVLAAWYGLPSAPLFAAARDNSAIADGEAHHFDFDTLQQMARELAIKPYQSTVEQLPETLAKLTPQQYNAIGFDPDHSLWHDQPERKLDVQFFHVGMAFNQPVRMYSLDPKTQQAREIHFDPELFNYENADVDVSQLEGKDNLGFAGFRAFKAPSLAERDILSFLGASYFRAVDETGQYGLSARGAAINTFADTPEEFPAFTRFWLQTPKPGDTTFTAYALLDSPSVAGAYRFVIHCEEARVVMDIDNHLYPRKAITQLGIAPMTSMFSCGTHQRRMCDTIHPQIHDSDRLSMWRGNGEWVCRPLNNPPRLQFNAFIDSNPKGFGLLQTDHDFSHYEDIVGFYHKRPSLWVEPKGKWGDGEIQLLEIPTTGETMDNIVCFWKPAQPIAVGQSLDFGYKLYWSAEPPETPTPELARVRSTRSGMGGFTEGWAPGEHYPEVWARRFAVDFVGGGIEKMPARNIPIEANISVARGEVRDVHILWVEPINGFRILFDWYPGDDTSTDPIDMRLVLEGGGKTLSETWLYQYFPPAPEKRTYPAHPNA